MPGELAEWSQFPAELSQFAVALKRNSKTSRTGRALDDFYKSLRSTWSATRRASSADPGIPIPLPRDQKLHPVGSVLMDAFVSFDFRLEDNAKHRADFQVRVTGMLELADSLVELEDHWRVDTDHAAVWTAREPHPPYHFQRGGHAQAAFAQRDYFVPGPALSGSITPEWSGLMQCAGPRMLTPPMCPMLAIDFAISQHDGVLWRRLREEDEYRRWIVKSQKRLWLPYFEQLNGDKGRRALIGPLLALPS